MLQLFIYSYIGGLIMKELIKTNEFGISVLNKDESIVISSRTVADVFNKHRK